MLLGLLGALPVLLVLFLVFALLFAHNLPARAVTIAVLAALTGLAFLAFWFWAKDPWTRGSCIVLATLFTLASALEPDVLHGAYLLWLYPAVVIGFGLRPLRAIASVIALGLITLLVVVIDSSIRGFSTGQTVGAAIPPLAVLALGSWASITVAQLLWNNADLQAAREELARFAVEEERARFGRDLHDLLGHTLSLIVVKLELATRLLPSGDSAARTELQEIEQITREALRDVREVASGYRQPTLAAELAGAGVALEAAGINLALDKRVGMLAPEVEATVAWTVREGVTNVVRHSGARHCTIRISQGDDAVSVEILDDGRSNTVPKPGMGLTGLRERIQLRGGTVQWQAAATHGFELSAVMPLSGTA